MKVAVVADIHGNYAALQAVLADIDKERVDEIISLGDNIGYGPEPEEVVRTLQKRDVVSILGNHEYAILNERCFKRLNPNPKKSLELSRAMMTPASLEYSKRLPKILIRHGARLVHGCPPKSPTSYLINPDGAKLAKLFASFSEKLCFFGHTHTIELYDDQGQASDMTVGIGPFDLSPENRYLINPGSVGQPRDDIDNHAKYIIWDMGKARIEVKSIPYDVMDTVNKLKKLGFPDFNAERLLL
ncbi:MAG: metallophosphoesterase family protein [Desulfobulbaceae bacterium]|nr:metallophosphoesterase family protein [Desulfobulbaceae bacterium]